MESAHEHIDHNTLLTKQNNRSIFSTEKNSRFLSSILLEHLHITEYLTNISYAPPKKTVKEKLQSALPHFKNHRQMMRYAVHVKKDLPINPGVNLSHLHDAHDATALCSGYALER
ncbi:MAG: hypothetical protein EPN17_04215 [Methylobacter sp.]|nr:MAG: hypothetical protein EPN17_04215 [Methylobacter sp.]